MISPFPQAVQTPPEAGPPQVTHFSSCCGCDWAAGAGSVLGAAVGTSAGADGSGIGAAGSVVGSTAGSDGAEPPGLF